MQRSQDQELASEVGLETPTVQKLSQTELEQVLGAGDDGFVSVGYGGYGGYGYGGGGKIKVGRRRGFWGGPGPGPFWGPRRFWW